MTYYLQWTRKKLHTRTEIDIILEVSFWFIVDFFQLSQLEKKFGPTLLKFIKLKIIQTFTLMIVCNS